MVKQIFRGIVHFCRSPYVFGPVAFLFAYTGYEYATGTQRSSHCYVIGDQKDKTYIITGASSGIGRQLARELAFKRATVIMACRDKHRCQEARRNIVLSSKNKKVFCRQCDQSDPASIFAFVKKISKEADVKKIDGLILNAGTKSANYKTNQDGVELTLATNHMGSFLMVGLLLQKLLEQEGPSKILFVGTDISAKDNLKLELDKLNEAKYSVQTIKHTETLDPENGKYDMHGAYKFSKMMQLIFAKELAERLKDTKVSVMVADPGGTKSGLDKDEASQNFYLTRWSANFFGWLTGARRKPEITVSPILYTLCDPEVQNGMFVNPRRKHREWGANAENDELRQSVWAMSEKWTKLAEHMQKMEEELEKPQYYANDPEKIDMGDRGRRLRFFGFA